MVHRIWKMMEKSKSWVKWTLGTMDPFHPGDRWLTAITNQPRRNDEKTADYRTYYTKNIITYIIIGWKSNLKFNSWSSYQNYFLTWHEIDVAMDCIKLISGNFSIIEMSPMPVQITTNAAV